MKSLKRTFFASAAILFSALGVNAQTNPAILNWIRNTDGLTGRHYVQGNSTPIDDAVEANVEFAIWEPSMQVLRGSVYTLHRGFTPIYILSVFHPELRTIF